MDISFFNLILIFLLNVVTWHTNAWYQRTFQSIQYIEETHYSVAHIDYSSQADEDDYSLIPEAGIQERNPLERDNLNTRDGIIEIDSATLFNSYLSPLQLDIPPPFCS